MTEQNASHRSEHGLTKLLLEMGPLVLFFAANSKPEWFKPIVGAIFGQGVVASDKAPILIATAVFMVGMLASLVATWALYRRLPIMPLVSGAVVLVFGGLTLALHNDLFIKLKPTIVNSLFERFCSVASPSADRFCPTCSTACSSSTPRAGRSSPSAGRVLFRACRHQRGGVAHADHRFLGGLQGLGRDAAYHGFALAQTPMMMRHGFDPGK